MYKIKDSAAHLNILNYYVSTFKGVVTLKFVANEDAEVTKGYRLFINYKDKSYPANNHVYWVDLRGHSSETDNMWHVDTLKEHTFDIVVPLKDGEILNGRYQKNISMYLIDAETSERVWDSEEIEFISNQIPKPELKLKTKMYTGAHGITVEADLILEPKETKHFLGSYKIIAGVYTGHGKNLKELYLDNLSLSNSILFAGLNEKTSLGEGLLISVRLLYSNGDTVSIVERIIFKPSVAPGQAFTLGGQGKNIVYGKGKNKVLKINANL